MKLDWTYPTSNIQEPLGYRKASCLFLVLVAYLLYRNGLLVPPRSEMDIAYDLLARYPLIDTHNDLPGRIFDGQLVNFNLTNNTGHTDLIRMRKGRFLQNY